MLQFYIADPRRKWQIQAPLNLKTGGINGIRLALNFEVAHKLEFDINPSIGNIYEQLTFSEEYGILVRNVDNNGKILKQFGFIRDRESFIEHLSGRIQMSFLSAVYSLSTSQKRYIPNDTLYKGSAINLIANISGGETTFVAVSPDFEISFDTGVLNNLDLLNEVVKTVPSWTWVDDGIDPLNNVNIIKFGDFTNQEPEYKVRMVKIDDPFYTDTLAILSDSSLNYNNDQITHLKVVGTYTESDENNETKNKFVYLTSKDYNFILPDFPLLDIGETDVDGNKIFYIQNVGVFSSVKYNKYKSLEVSVNNNKIDPAGNRFIDIQEARRQIYNEAVNYLQSKSYTSELIIDTRTPKLLAPGTVVTLMLNEPIKSWDSEYKPMADLRDAICYISNIEYDLTASVTGLKAKVQLVANPKNRPPAIGQAKESVKLSEIERQRVIKLRK